MDVVSRFYNLRFRLFASVVAVGCCALGSILVEVGPMKIRETIASTAAWIAAKAFGDPSYYRDFNKVPLSGGGVKSELAQPYKQSVWVMSAINAVTQPLKSVSLKFYRGDVEVEDKDLAAFWRNPAESMSYEEFIDASAGWFKLKGEFFWLLDDTWFISTRSKSKLKIVRPDRIHHIVVAGELLGWEIKDDNGRIFRVPSEYVIQAKRWNPFNLWRGLGEMEAALLAAETDFLAGKYAHDVFANAGEDGDYLVAKSGVPTEPQREQIVEALRARRAARLRGEFSPVFLTGDIEIKNASVTPPDAGFVANRMTNRHEVYIAFRVPASMADVQASYSIGSASDYFRLIFDTCMPLGITLAGKIDILAQHLTGQGDVEAWFDWDEHPVMQAVRAERTDTAVKFFDRGISWKDINDMLDLGLVKFDGWEKRYMPFSLAEVGATDAKPEPAPVDVPPAEAAAKGLSRLRELFLTRPKAKADSRDPRRVALARMHERKRRPMEKAFAAKFSRVLQPFRKEVLQNIDNARHEAKGIVTKAAAADLTFTLADFQKSLRVEMRKQSLVALQRAGQEMFEELAKDDVFSMAPKAALTFLAQRENRMSDAAEEVHDQITSTLQAGLDDGDTMDELAARIRAAFNGIDKGRAQVIAVTETAAAYGVGRHDAMEQAGIQYKQWLTAGDDHVRDSHIACEAEVVALHENFSCGLAFPGDPAGPPEEVINCRCVQIAVAGKEQNA